MILLNKQREILDLVLNKIRDAKKIYLAISFLTWSGLKELINNSNFLNKEIEVITTTDEYITDCKSLLFFFNNNIKVRILNKEDINRSFHSKFIIFEYENNEYENMIGSLNLTHNAFFHKYETVIFNKNDSLLNEFNYLWKLGKPLDRKFLEEYQKRYHNYKNHLKRSLWDFEYVLNSEPMKLNEMQSKVLKELKKVRENNENRALLWAATGTGKTYLSALDARNFMFNKLLFIVHNRSIIRSTIRDYKNIFKENEIMELFSNNIRLIKDKKIIFTTQFTLSNIIENNQNFLAGFDYFIFDEAHKIGPKNQQGEIFKRIMNKKNIFILSMTATPERSDNPLFLFNNFKNVVGKIDLALALKKNLICNFNYYGINVDVEFDKPTIAEKDLDLMIDKLHKKLKEIKIWDNGKIKGIIFTQKIEEAEEVVKKLNNKSLLSVPIHTNSEYGSNEEKIVDFVNKLQSEKDSLNFLVTVNKFNEGIDIPKINTIVMFRFTNSSIIYTQQIGRGLRKLENEDKYLNIIDLIGNHENNFARIAGISGKNYLNPKNMLDILHKWKNIKNKGDYDFEISQISIKRILDSLSEQVRRKKISYKKYFFNELFEIKNMYQEKMRLIDLETKLGEPIQIITNNIRHKKTHQYGDLSWISIILKKLDVKTITLTKTEEQLVELFSWMPFTVSSPKEKKLIIELLNNYEVKLPRKWISYFLGKNQSSGRISQLVKGDFSNFFKYDANRKTLKFEYFNKSTSFRNVLAEILEYLNHHKERNDMLVPGNWYSKAEIGFMANYTSNVSKGTFPRYKHAVDDQETFLLNKIREKEGGLYFNEIVGENNFIVCKNDLKDFKEEKQILNFLGSDVFYNFTLYKYIGKPKEIRKKDIKENKERYYGSNSKNSNYQYQRYAITTEYKLSDEESLYFKFNPYLIQDNKVVE